MSRGFFTEGKLAIGKGVEPLSGYVSSSKVVDFRVSDGIGGNTSIFSVVDTGINSHINVSNYINMQDNIIKGLNTSAIVPGNENEYLDYAASVQYVINKIENSTQGGFENLEVSNSFYSNGSTYIGNSIEDEIIVNGTTTFNGSLIINGTLSGVDMDEVTDTATRSALDNSSLQTITGTKNFVDSVTIGNVTYNEAPIAHFEIASSDASNPPHLRFEYGSSLDQVSGDDIITNMSFWGQRSNNFKVGAQMLVRQDGTWSTSGTDINDAPSKLEFYTQSISQLDNGLDTPRLTIHSTGQLSIHKSIASTSTNSGSLVITGGTGIGGNLYVGAHIDAGTTLKVNSGDNATSISNGALNIVGGVGIGKDVYIGGLLNVLEDSTFNKDIVVTGNLTVLGTNVITNTETTQLEDPLLILGNGSINDILDIGFLGEYTSGGLQKYAGLFRDATTSEFYLVGDIAHNPLTDNIVGAFDVNNYANFNVNSLLVNATLNVDGAIDADVTDFDVISSGGFSIDSVQNSNISVTSNDVTDQTLTISSTNSGTGSGVIAVDSDKLNISSTTNITNITGSTSKDTGALVVEGGVGIEENLYVGGNTNIIGDLYLTGDIITGGGSNAFDIVTINTELISNGSSYLGYNSTDQLIVNATSTFNSPSTFNSTLLIIDTTDSINKDTGALVIEGGIGIEKNLNVGANVGILGTLNVDGQTNFDKLFVNTELVVNGSTYLGFDSSDELIVNATSTFGSTVNINGIFTAENNIIVNGNSTFNDVTIHNSGLTVSAGTLDVNGTEGLSVYYGTDRFQIVKSDDLKTNFKFSENNTLSLQMNDIEELTVSTTVGGGILYPSFKYKDDIYYGSVDISGDGSVAVKLDANTQTFNILTYNTSTSTYDVETIDFSGVTNISTSTSRTINISSNGKYICVGLYNPKGAIIYEKITGVWSQKGSLVGLAASNYPETGYTATTEKANNMYKVSNDGTRLIIADAKLSFGGNEYGGVTVYEYITSDWVVETTWFSNEVPFVLGFVVNHNMLEISDNHNVIVVGGYTKVYILKFNGTNYTVGGIIVPPSSSFYLSSIDMREVSDPVYEIYIGRFRSNTIDSGDPKLEKYIYNRSDDNMTGPIVIFSTEFYTNIGYWHRTDARVSKDGSLILVLGRQPTNGIGFVLQYDSNTQIYTKVFDIVPRAPDLATLSNSLDEGYISDNGNYILYHDLTGAMSIEEVVTDRGGLKSNIISALVDDLEIHAKNNLVNVTSNTQFTKNIEVQGTSTLIGDVTANNNLNVTGISTLTGAVTAESTLAVTGTSTLTGNVIAQNNLDVTGTSTLTGNVTAENTLSVVGNSTLTGDVTMNNSLSVNGISTLTGDVTAQNNLDVTGTSTLTGDVIAQSNLNVTGASLLTGNVSILSTTGSTSKDTGALIIEGGVGIEENLYIGGLTNIGGNAIVNGNLNVLGITSFSGNSEFDILYVSNHTYLGNNYETDVFIVNATSTFNTDVALNGNVSINSPDTITLDSINDITLDSSTGNIGIGTDAVIGAINIGTGASARTITVGNDVSTKVDVNALAIELDSAGPVDIDATTSLSLNTLASQNINIGNDAVAQTVNIGNSVANAVNIDAISISIDSTNNSNITLTAADVNDKTLTISATNSGAGKALIDIDAEEDISIDSSTGSLNIGTNADNGSINIGTGASARTITVGNDASTKVDVNALAIELDSAGPVDIDATTSLSLNTLASQSINIGNDVVAQTVNIGNVAATAVNIDAISLSLDSSNNSNLSLTANDVSDKTLTISASNSGAGAGIIDITSSDNVYVDSSAGSINIGTDNNTGAVNIGTSTTARNINIGNDASTKVDINALNIELDSAGSIMINATSGLNLQTLGGQTINIGTEENGQTLMLGNHISAATHLHGGYVHIDSRSDIVIDLNANSGVDKKLKITASNAGAGKGIIDILADHIDLNGSVCLLDTTGSISKDTGALIVEGGVGIEENLYVGGYINVAGVSSFDKDVVITGNLTVLGNESITNTLISVTNDPLIILGNGSTNDSLDIGFMGQYDAGSGPRYTGLFRDATNSEFYLVQNIEHSPQSDNIISPFDSTNYANLNVNGLLVQSTLDINGAIDADVTSCDIHCTGLLSIYSFDNANLTLSADNALSKTLTIEATNSGAGNATIDINAENGITIDSSSGNISLGSDNNTGAINIGTSVSARTITVGNDASTKVDVNALAIELDSAGPVDIDATTSLSLNTLASQNINIGTDAVAQTVNIGNTVATAVNVDAISLSLDASDNSNITLTAADVNDKTLTISATNSGAGKALIDIDAEEDISIDSSAGALNIGTNADIGAINIGTGASARTITVGNDASTKVDVNALAIELDSAGSIDIDATTSLSLNTLASQSINIGNDAVSQTVNVGNVAATAINIDAIALSLDSTDNSNFTLTANDSSDKTLTISATNGGVGNGIVNIASDQFNVSSITTVTNITDSISKDTGALVVEGGVGIERDLYVGGNITISENLNVNGISTYTGDSNFDVLNVNIALNSLGSTYIGSDNLDELIVNATSLFNETVRIKKTTEQLKVCYDDTKFLSFTTDSNSYTTIKPSNTGRVYIKATTDNTQLFKVVNSLDSPIITCDSTNIRTGFGTTIPGRRVDINDNSGNAQLRLTYNTGIYSDMLVDNNGDLIINSIDRTRIKPTNDSTGAFEVNTSGNVNVFTVDTSNQRVGIGNSTPATSLDIISTIDDQLRIGYDEANYINVNTDNTGISTISTAGTTNRLILKPSGSDNTNFFKVQDFAGTSILSVDSTNEYVVIGSDIANRKLEIVDNSGNAQIRISNNATIYSELITDINNDLILSSQQSTRVQPTIDTTGAFEVNSSSNINVFTVDTSNQRVGVGISAPLAKLDVASLTEQLRLTYDYNSYSSFTMDNTNLSLLNQYGGVHIKGFSHTNKFSVQWSNNDIFNVDTSIHSTVVRNMRATTGTRVFKIISDYDTQVHLGFETTYPSLKQGSIILKNTGDLQLAGNRDVVSTTGFTCINTVDSTSITTGSVRFSGGAGISKNLYVGGLIYGENDLTIDGNGTFKSITVYDHTYLGTASSDELIVNSTSTFNADVNINGDITAISPTLISMTSGGKIDMQAADGNIIVFNEDELNTDFRISGNGTNGDVTNLFYVDVDQQDTGNSQNTYDGCIGIGKMPGNVRLDIIGNIRTSGHFVASSDRRLKKNITVLPNALDNIMKIKGVTFEWRKDEFPDRQLPNGKQVGVIAQDVESVCPEIVNTDENGYKTVAYDRLTSLLIESVKEQQEQIKNLTNIILSLQQKLDS